MSIDGSFTAMFESSIWRPCGVRAGYTRGAYGFSFSANYLFHFQKDFPLLDILYVRRIFVFVPFSDYHSRFLLDPVFCVISDVPVAKPAG